MTFTYSAAAAAVCPKAAAAPRPNFTAKTSDNLVGVWKNVAETQTIAAEDRDFVADASDNAGEASDKTADAFDNAGEGSDNAAEPPHRAVAAPRTD